MSEPVAISDAEFEQEILKADIPAMVDFWAAWCGPCRAIAPVVEELARDYAGKVKVAKMNVDENAKTPAKYGIQLPDRQLACAPVHSAEGQEYLGAMRAAICPLVNISTSANVPWRPMSSSSTTRSSV